MTYHEIHYISRLPYSEYPDEEHLYSSSEIESRANKKSLGTYWEVLCHFHICMDKEKRRNGGLSFAKWSHYLVSEDLKALKRQKGIPLTEVEERLLHLE